MSHITASPPSSPPSEASGPDSGAHNSPLLLSANEREALFLPSTNVFKDSNECNAVTQKMDFREGEGEKKKAILCLWQSIITLLPSPHPFPTQAGVCFYVCVSVCVHLPLCVSLRACVPCEFVHTCL